MSIYLIVALGFILFVALSVFYWLIVLDLNIQRKQKDLFSSKVKSKLHYNDNVSNTYGKSISS